jgi:hypothetical protein
MEIVNVTKAPDNFGYLDRYPEVVLVTTPTSLMTKPEREMGRNVRNPEATKVSDEEYQG